MRFTILSYISRVKVVSRVAEASVRRALGAFRVVLIAGPRQAGKTTLARIVGGGRRPRRFVTLDDLGALAAAQDDPQGFIDGLPTPVTIDEVQRAPRLLLAIKRRVDDEPRRGGFLLTGSADPMAVRAVKDALAGRLSVLPLGPLTWSERARRPTWNPVTMLLRCRSPREVARRFPASEATRLDHEVVLGGFPEPALHLRARQRGLQDQRGPRQQAGEPGKPGVTW